MSRWPEFKGSWIWWERTIPTLDAGDYPPLAPDSLGYLRRRFDLSQTPVRATARVCANSRYVLYLNGHLLGRGPVRSEPLNFIFDTYDLAPFLQEGSNCLAAWCRYYGRPNVFWQPSVLSGEVGAGWFVLDAEIGEQSIVSDASWKAMPAPYDQHVPGIWERSNPGVEIVRGGELPDGWTDPSYDDSSWSHAIELEWSGLGLHANAPPADPHPYIAERPIPQLEDRALAAPTIVARGRAGYEVGDDPLRDFQTAVVEPSSLDGSWSLSEGEFVTLDAGAIVRAFPAIDIAAEGPCVVDLACGEDFGDDGRAVILPRQWVMRYHADGTGSVEKVRSFEALGFRYLTIRSSGPVTIRQVPLVESHYPRPPVASFESDDPVINEIWKAGVRTLDLCSTDAFIDCPGREQRAWLGDAWLTSLISLVSSPDTRLVRWNLRLHAQGQRGDGLLPAAAACDIALRPSTIPDFSLHWIRALAAVWRYTGDRSLLQELAVRIPAVIEFFEAYRAPDGLLTGVPGWVFIDWAQTKRGAKTAALDALYLLALQDFRDIAEPAGLPIWQERTESLIERSRAGFEAYWDPTRGVYVDAIDEDKHKRVSQQTNSLAILSGCAAQERWPGIFDRILDESRVKRTKTPGDSFDWAERLGFQWADPEDFDDEADVVEAQMFFTHFLHQALAIAGRRDEIASSMRRWGRQALAGNGCFEEYWDALPGGGSRCHVWSATPVYDLSTHFLGVSPALPGFREARISPYFGPFARLKGSVPTPQGPIVVDLERVGELVRGEVEVPIGITASIGFDEFPHLGRADIEGPSRFSTQEMSTQGPSAR